MRETLFNWLGQTLYGKRCLDLFAGSGALGFEAASRGAEQVLMVENNRGVYRALQDNLKKLGLSNVALRCEDGLKFARQDNGLFDVAFLDPPFKSDYLPQLLPLLEKSIEGVETNEKVAEILKAVVTVYGPQDSGSITQSVESVELSTPQQPEFKIPIRDIVFHTTLLVPSRIEVQVEFTLPAAVLARLNQAMGY